MNEVVLGKEEIKTWPEVKWLAAAKVLMEKSFSLESLKKTLHAAWTPAREVTFHAVEENLFVLQAHCLGDWNRIKYEKILRFCDHCGRMGHTFLECGSGEYEDAAVWRLDGLGRAILETGDTRAARAYCCSAGVKWWSRSACY
ncbi:hypothetical protein QYE76_057556 [Lolium multiflorum]|uniref:CCHC-type domain-containing protein n=1 Tax=Lolium multiflorum TaxID=4521 RepID=A0AAD8WNX1_LOLMU|nr:hypothetical protein QYE76_057556 [Lolium multiflorum]